MIKLSITVGMILLLEACGQATGTEGTEVATQCVQQELGMICPLGTSPKLSANAMSSCNQETDFSGGLTSDASGQIGVSGNGSNSSVCVGSGDCFIECELIISCEHGYETFTREMIVCANAPDGTDDRK